MTNIILACKITKCIYTYYILNKKPELKNQKTANVASSWGLGFLFPDIATVIHTKVPKPNNPNESDAHMSIVDGMNAVTIIK